MRVRTMVPGCYALPLFSSTWFGLHSFHCLLAIHVRDSLLLVAFHIVIQSTSTTNEISLKMKETVRNAQFHKIAKLLLFFATPLKCKPQVRNFSRIRLTECHATSELHLTETCFCKNNTGKTLAIMVG